MDVKATSDVVKDAPNSAFSRNEDRLAVVGIAVNSLYGRGADEKGVFAIFYFVFIVAASGLDVRDLPHPLRRPLVAKSRRALLAGKQFLHGALFDAVFFVDESFKGFDENIRIAQRLGNGFLFASC